MDIKRISKINKKALLTFTSSKLNNNNKINKTSSILCIQDQIDLERKIMYKYVNNLLPIEIKLLFRNNRKLHPSLQYKKQSCTWN